ncbi:hypothetical protein NYE70_05955 [Paenibacillus sp. FSL R5-0407]|uniref:hypothetical protein n=1 Tax=Paenibacillus sp. FSL R5-0407 TaxID=2975320 RepID=UPI0030F68C91
MNHIGQGRTADIFEYKDDKIIKLYKKDFPEDAINQEFLISNFAYSLGIHTPQPFELKDINGRQGRVCQDFCVNSLSSKSPEGDLAFLT